MLTIISKTWKEKSYKLCNILKEGKKSKTKISNLFRNINFMNIAIVTFYEKQDIQTEIQYLANKWSSNLKDFRIIEVIQLNL